MRPQWRCLYCGCTSEEEAKPGHATKIEICGDCRDRCELTDEEAEEEIKEATWLNEE